MSVTSDDVKAAMREGAIEQLGHALETLPPTTPDRYDERVAYAQAAALVAIGYLLAASTA